MRQKQITDSFYEWLNLSIEDKYMVAQKSYFEKFPNGTNSDFHLMEIEFLKKELRKYDEGEKLQWFEIKSAIEKRKLLEYYAKLENTNETLPAMKENINNTKLKWKGTPAQFGFIIDLLIQGGYLEKPTSSFAKDANFYIRFFEIETTTPTLAKELSENTNSLSTTNRKKFDIPNKDKLS